MSQSLILEQPTLQDLLAVYRFLFDNEPDGTLDLAQVLSDGVTWDGVRKAIYASGQFQEFLSRRQIGSKSLDGPARRVDIYVDATKLKKMFARIEAAFTELGKTEPYWAVSTNDNFRKENISTHRTEFFERGKNDINTLLQFATRANMDLRSFGKCFELGCGVGRVTFHLAQIFNKVIGWDIAKPMIAEAKMNASEFGYDSVDLHAVEEFSEFEDLKPFDFFFSRIVLQHNPPPVSFYILSKVLEKLRAGGVALFQIPTYGFGYSFDADRYLLSPPKNSFEMHCVPQRAILDLLEQRGCKILEIREDGATGPGSPWVSNTFFVQKRSEEIAGAGSVTLRSIVAERANPDE